MERARIGIKSWSLQSAGSTTTVVGQKFKFNSGPNAIYELHFIDDKHLDVTVVEDVSYPMGVASVPPTRDGHNH